MKLRSCSSGSLDLLEVMVRGIGLTRIEQIGNLRDRRDSPRGRMCREDHDSKRSAITSVEEEYGGGCASAKAVRKPGTETKSRVL